MKRYTLVITEKPDAARRIALALDKQHKPVTKDVDGVPYYTADNDGRIVVVPTLGHMYTVTGQRSGRDFYPVFAFTWVPRFLAEREAGRIRIWLNSISKLSKGAGSFVDACDYDIEGSLIGYSIMKYACGNKEKLAKRMKYSTLTGEELEKSFFDLLPSLDFGLIEAGKTRHEVDWLYGVNLSRALTIAAKKASGKYETLSTGRVQGPVLSFLGRREVSIKSFVPTPYWEMKARFELDGRIYEAYCEKTVETKREAEMLYNECLRETGRIDKIRTTQNLQSPPFPFDLGTLQSEAYRLFRYTPRHTLETAQRLYLEALISYPRTSSQKLPPNIDYRKILRNLNRFHRYRSMTEELLTLPILKPRQGAKDDPAHPAIYPTGVVSRRSLTASEEKILDLVVRRFMAVFGISAIVQCTTTHVKIGSHLFFLNGRTLLIQGWRKFYEPYVYNEEALLPSLKEGQHVKIEKILLLDRFTQPPSRYNVASLLKKMEGAQIGTKSTRADVIQILYDRRYVRNERIEMTELGFEVLETLNGYCPTVVSVGLTRELERRMEKIHVAGMAREEVLDDVVNILRPALAQLKVKEIVIGRRLSSAMAKGKLEEKIVGSCPVCKTGRLMILRSRKTGKQFIGCSNYFNGLCSTSYALPQMSSINVTSKVCKYCGWPVVLARARRRRAWMLCFNPECHKRRRRKIDLQNMPQTG